MTVMGPNIFLLKPNHGKKTTLDKAYNKHVSSIVKNIDEEEESRWEIYSIIIQDLISKGKDHYLKEIKYRVTDGEAPSEIMLDIIERESEIDGVDSMIFYFKRRIEEYIEDDYYKNFLV